VADGKACSLACMAFRCGKLCDEEKARRAAGEAGGACATLAAPRCPALCRSLSPLSLSPPPSSSSRLRTHPPVLPQTPQTLL